jgi:hypothetical protein
MNPISKHNIYLYEGHRAKFIPHLFFCSLCEEWQIDRKKQAEEVVRAKVWRSKFVSPRGFGGCTPRFQFMQEVIGARKEFESKSLKKLSKTTF